MSTGDFTTPDDMTDVTFVVEEERLYFNKTLLSICSPVFKKMFQSDFKEKDSAEIPLPDKKLDEFVLFLQQIHPCHAAAKALTDSELDSLLVLSDEYQVDHVRQKCQQHIKDQLDYKGWLPTDTLLLYFLLCEKHSLHDHRNMLLYMAAGRAVSELEKTSYFPQLPQATQAELVKTRCLILERKLEDSDYLKNLNEEQRVMQMKARVFQIPVICLNALPDSCKPACYMCPHGSFFNTANDLHCRDCNWYSVIDECKLSKKDFCKKCIVEKINASSKY